jgi:hypothetical protein
MKKKFKYPLRELRALVRRQNKRENLARLPTFAPQAFSEFFCQPKGHVVANNGGWRKAAYPALNVMLGVIY